MYHRLKQGLKHDQCACKRHYLYLIVASENVNCNGKNLPINIFLTEWIKHLE